MATFSIIVPVYNVEKYLSQCIDSVLAQTFKDFELLLVDDGSTDSSPLICDEYAAKDNRIKVFHKINGGVSSARNFGIGKALGEYLWFVDSDDYLEKHALESLLKFKGNDIVYLGYKFFNDETGETIYQTELTCKQSVDEDSFNDILYDMLNLYVHLYGCVWSKVIKRNLVVENNILFDVNVSYKEDELFLQEILLVTKSIAVCGEGILYNYRKLASGLSRNIRSTYEHENIVRRCKDLAYKLPLNDKLISSYENRLCRNLITIYKRDIKECNNLKRQWTLIQEIVYCHKHWPSKDTRKFVKLNTLVTFLFYLLRKVIKKK